MNEKMKNFRIFQVKNSINLKPMKDEGIKKCLFTLFMKQNLTIYIW